MAERVLEYRPKAEQLVAGLCRQQAGLVTTATHSAIPSQRDAARAELERLVRRATLDALPPVITKRSTAPGRPASSTATPASRKRVEPASGKTAGRAARPTLAPPPPPIATAPRRPSEPAPGAPHRRSAGQPTGLADLPSTATAVEAKTQHRGRKLALTAVAVLLGGLGFSYLAYTPEDANGPHIARLPASSPQLAAPPAEPDPPSTTELSLESLQLEAVEGSTGPLRDRVGLTEPTSSAPPQQAAALESDLRLVLLHQSNSTAAARADELRTTLATLKDPPEIELRSVGFTIVTPRIRYFHTDDATSAAALATLLAPPTNGTGTWQVQDFTDLRPSPTQGTLEVFIPTTGS